MNGVSLRRINRTHDFSDVNHSLYPIDTDSYHIKIDPDINYGTDRTTGNAATLSQCYTSVRTKSVDLMIN